MSSSKGSPSTTTMSLPSIHEMFPDHLLPKDESPRPHSHRGYTYPHSPGVHHTANHRDRAHEPQCICTHTGCLRHTDDRHLLSQQQPQGSPSSSSKRRPSSMNSSQNIYAFNVLRSSPSSASLQHITSSSTVPNRPANPQQLGSNSVVGSGSSPAFRVEGHASSGRTEYREYQDGRDAMSHASSSDGYASISSQRTRSSVIGDPHAAIISFPLSRSGPLPPSPSKHHQYPPRRSSSSGTGIRNVEDVYPSHGAFHVHEGLGNEEEDDGNSGVEDNDTSNGKKHVCPTCFKRFNRPSSLRIHVNTHTGATPFRCPWPNCGREFNVNSNMRRHYRNHTTPGFSRSQNANNPASNANNNPPTDGRRKRRRVNIPASQIPPSGNRSPTSGSHPYPPGQASHRSEYQYRHPAPSHPHNQQAAYTPQFSQPQQHVRSSHAYPHLHPGTHVTPSPPISNLSMSEEDSSSGSESDVDSDMKYSAVRSRVGGNGASNNMNMKKMEEDDELLEYEPDSASLRYRTASLTQSLARVAVAPSHRNHPYSPYQSHGRSHPHYSQSSSTPVESHDAHDDSRRRLKVEQVYTYERHGSNAYTRPHRPLTPGSSFHSSSASASASPSPHLSSSSQESNLSPTSSSQSNYKYNASTPYVRSLADSRVSTTLRPAFAGSNEREKSW